VLNALQPSRDGLNDAIIAKISNQPMLRTMLQGPDMVVQWRAFAPEFHLESNMQPGTNWTFLAPAPPPTNGWHTLRIGATNAGDFFRLKL
jgi:hypothetical protein